jgi:hypothetical protein
VLRGYPTVRWRAWVESSEVKTRLLNCRLENVVVDNHFSLNVHRQRDDWEKEEKNKGLTQIFCDRSAVAMRLGARLATTKLTLLPRSSTTSWTTESPDGKWIAYASARSGHFALCRKPSDGSGAEETLLTET